jgi:hypothetical protein
MFAIFGILCALTRMQGAVLIGAALVELTSMWFESRRRAKKVNLHKKKSHEEKMPKEKSIYIKVNLNTRFFALAPIIGIIIYLFINYQIKGDPFAFIGIQQELWYNKAQFFGITAMNQFRYLLSTYYWGNGMNFYLYLQNILSMIIALALMGYWVIKKRSNALIAFAVGVFFLSFSLSALLSGGRYMVSCAPLFMAFAELMSKRKSVFIGVILLMSVVLMFILMKRFMMGGIIS